MKTTIESSGRMHNPAHPGEILKEMYMGPLGVTITQTADALGVSRKHVSGIVNGRVPVSPDMAARLASVFGTEPDIWINLQAQYDLWQVGGSTVVRRSNAWQLDGWSNWGRCQVRLNGCRSDRRCTLLNRGRGLWRHPSTTLACRHSSRR